MTQPRMISIPNGNGALRRMPAQEYEKNKAICEAGLKECNGYIFAYDRQKLEEMISRQKYSPLEDPLLIINTSRQFMESCQEYGIPGVWHKKFETPAQHLFSQLSNGEKKRMFPMQDILMRLASGTYNIAFLGRRQWFLENNIVGAKDKVVQASIDDLAFFRTYAMTDAEAKPEFIREVGIYLNEEFKPADPKALQNAIEKTAKMLCAALSRVKTASNVYQSYEPGDISCIERPFWHMQYQPKDIRRILTE